MAIGEFKFQPTVVSWNPPDGNRGFLNSTYGGFLESARWQSGIFKFDLRWFLGIPPMAIGGFLNSTYGDDQFLMNPPNGSWGIVKIQPAMII